MDIHFGLHNFLDCRQIPFLHIPAKSNTEYILQIRLILACGTANPLEQIVWMDKNKFEEHMANEEKILTDEQRTAAQQLQRALSLLPIENPFEYVKSIQKDFDGSKIQYSDEYYEVTGIENPKGTNTQDKHLVEFEPVVFEFNRKQDSD